jgi:hypothetical protein
MPRYTVSIVSHGQAKLVAALLDDLDHYCAKDHVEVLLVINVPEDEAPLRLPRGVPVTVLRNASQKGFGANHNLAFSQSRGEVFIVANPDIRLTADPLPALARALRDPTAGVCAPRVVAKDGRVEDNVRRFPSVSRLLERHVLRRSGPDYDARDLPLPVDWAAGMFLALRRDTYLALRGFDERYFMYLEDVDLCRRVHAHGLRVLLQPSVAVTHDARRSSRRNARHLAWHVQSMFRYLSRLHGNGIKSCIDPSASVWTEPGEARS